MLFIKHSSQGKIATRIVYVDDIVVTGDDLEVIVQLKKSLSKEFEIKNLGVLKYFLCMRLQGLTMKFSFHRESMF